MKILNNIDLKKYTTIRIGGCAQNFYIPESRQELVDLISELGDEEFYILGGGSNILINDNKEFSNVIYTNRFDNSITNLNNGKYYVGASVRLQNLINAINKDGYGGLEYLYSVPGFIGGAIVMNAGRGRQFDCSISDFLEEVYVYINGEVKTFSKEECKFGYRSSIFKNSKLIILGALFVFNKIDESTTNQLKIDRLNLCKATQDNSGYNFGSVFMVNNSKIMLLLKKINLGYKDGVMFSKKTQNWIINKGNGDYNQAKKLINTAILLHKVIGKKSIPEVIIWE